MTHKLVLCLIFAFAITTTHGQESGNSFFTPTKYGIQLSQGNENSFLFDDPDYFYKTNIIKGQLYFPITKLKKIELYLVIQPQLQFVQHQLYNEQFVRPEENNYQEKRQRFTQLKKLSITALEFSLEAKKQLFKNLSVFIQASLGFSYIDTETERLAKGFTFLENGNLGFEFKINSKIDIQFFGGLGHVSNLNFQSPNSGYSIFNSGLGIQYSVK